MSSTPLRGGDSSWNRIGVKWKLAKYDDLGGEKAREEASVLTF